MNDKHKKLGAKTQRELIRKGGSWAEFGCSWDLFCCSFGWFQFKKKLSPDEQAAFKEGFRSGITIEPKK